MEDKPKRPATAHIPPFGLRLQPELKALLERAAVSNGRSLNAEIVARLEQTVQGLPHDAPLEDIIQALANFRARSGINLDLRLNPPE